ncbi:ATP-binding cassette domain-containing protein [Tumebacillus flagellatus]|uniref:ATP-binding cassette domain-containing protein n=1 Tax=Tumebacillus flagellatus TaxID=1157490 RepID=UPI0013765742|nr:dipeptide/oligopeptide/nickel ABC transporter ATP-binding protein [Tumebacillus flagellatus]
MKPKHVLALQRFSLRVEAGSCVGLVGSSGSGKSTLARLILGLDHPDEGQILFEGVDVHRAGGTVRQQLRRDMQIVFQDCWSALNPRWTVGRSIVEPIRNFEKRTEHEQALRVEELLELTGLHGCDRHKYPHQMSGGQLQRVNIARAIALHPKLLVLDEAVSSLDRIVQVQILNLLRELQARFGMAYLFISHDREAVHFMADRVVTMDKEARS